jgi:hypothetical protein
MKIEVGNKNLEIRKWRGGDKKKFLAALNKKDLDINEVMQTLVYDCIEEKVTLSPDEFKYVLSRIRAYSLGEEFNVEFYCDGCGNVFKKTLLLKDTVRYTYKELNEINVQGVSIKLSEIRNKEFYIKKISEDLEYDFLLRIQEINGNESFTLQELESIIDDIDIDILTNIAEIWEDHKFKMDDINTVHCDCGKSYTYKFDEIPEFLPTSWFK